MLEYLVTTTPITTLRIGSTGNLEGLYSKCAKLLLNTRRVEDGWYNLLLPEPALSFCIDTERNIVAIGKESGSIYHNRGLRWKKLEEPPVPVTKVYCTDIAIYALSTEGDLLSFSAFERKWYIHSSPFPLVTVHTHLSAITAINNQGQLYVIGNNYFGQLGIRKGGGRIYSLTHCPVPDDELVTTIRAGCSEHNIPFTIITTASGKKWRAGDKKEGWR